MNHLAIEQDMSVFRAGIASFMQQETKKPLIITQHGKGVSVLLDVSEYEAMQEKIALLEDIQTATAQLSEGKGVKHDAAKQMVLDRLNQ